MTLTNSEERSLEIRTGCRLHFGLMELCPNQPLRFAGLGLMLESPGWHLAFARLRPNGGTTVEQLTAVGFDKAVDVSDVVDEVHGRIQHVIQRSGESQGRVSVRVLRGLPMHSGLGGGTQLACAVATGLMLLRNPLAIGEGTGDAPPLESESSWQSVTQCLPEMHASQLAKAAGRGLRSAIGLQGFLGGGLVLDGGHTGDGVESRDVVAEQRLLPEAWRIVLIQPPQLAMIAGQREVRLLEQMAARPNPAAERMYALARQTLETCQDFQSCTASMDEYMARAGELFAPWQGGPYNGSSVTAAVGAARTAGLAAVGQSSWGPAVFGLTDNEPQALAIATKLRKQANAWQITVTRPARGGAQVRPVA